MSSCEHSCACQLKTADGGSPGARGPDRRAQRRASHGRVRRKGSGPSGRNSRDWPSPQYGEALESARGAYAAATTALGDHAGFFDLNRGSDAEIARRLVEMARIYDLVILGQSHDAEPVPARLPEQTIHESGRPVLVVPYVGNYPDVGERPCSPGTTRAAPRAPPSTCCPCSPRTATR